MRRLRPVTRFSALGRGVRVGNTTRRGLLEWFEPLLGQVAVMVESGERLIELR